MSTAGWSRPVWVGRGKAGRGTAGVVWHGLFWRGMARQAWLGPVGLGVACRVAARQDAAGKSRLSTAVPGAASSRHGMARLGVSGLGAARPRAAWHGWAGSGPARLGVSGHGDARQARQGLSRNGRACRGPTWPARRVLAGQVMARHGLARQAWRGSSAHCWAGLGRPHTARNPGCNRGPVVNPSNRKVPAS